MKCLMEVLPTTATLAVPLEMPTTKIAVQHRLAALVSIRPILLCFMGGPLVTHEWAWCNAII